MGIDVLSPVIEGTQEMMEMMLGIECAPASPDAEIPEPFVSGVVSLTGKWEGQVVLRFPKGTGVKSVAFMLGMDEDEVDEESLKDGIGEMANMVAGGAKSRLAEAGVEFNLTVPTIVSGEGHRIDVLKVKTSEVRRLDCELGSFAVVVWMREKE